MGFIIGLFVGATIGVFVTALCTAGGDDGKQVPKRVEMTDNMYPLGICPCCKTKFIPHKEFKYCAYCGQTLDWSDTE